MSQTTNLVLYRNDFQTVVFPGLGITVTPVRSRRGKTSLAIQAPENVRIVRGELQGRPTKNDSQYDTASEGGAQ